MPLFRFEFKCENCHSIEEKFFKSPPITAVCSDCSGVSVRTAIPGRKTRRKTRGEIKTIYSRSMGVHPNQIADMEKNHPGRKYAPDGRLEVNGFQHQKKLAKEHNMVID
jgi:hypothetical protein